jgi:hypothetical protein
VFGWFRKREKPRIFLGELVVVPRAGFKAELEDEGLDTSIRDALLEIFALPPLGGRSAPLPSDLGLDVYIPSFQGGGALGANLTDLGIPVFFLFFWRPKVTVTCRLYHLQSRRTKRVLSATKKMPWREFFGRIFIPRLSFASRPAISAEDMNRLVNLACHALLTKLIKAV